MPARFITLEGIEGVGKTTQGALVCEFLRQHRIPVIATREPGGTEVGEKLRDLLLHAVMHNDTELLLMFAARAEHIQRVIRPALSNGQWVVCDRFTDATYAYQGAGRGISLERITQLEQWVQGDLRPHLTLLLDAPVDIGLHRVRQRRTWEERFDQDRFEQEQSAFFNSVRQGYLQLAKTDSKRYRVIDATLSVSEVNQQIQQVLHEWLT